MKSRLLIIIGIITLPLVLQQGFSQCIYNDDWPDAPCFDTGPVSHMEFNKAWAPYYEHKGSTWMETKRIELNQSIEKEIVEEWVEELENHNVYQYYLSRNEIQSQLPYDGLFVTLDPNFVNPESLDKSFEDTILDKLRVTDSKYTKNPNECWYQDDDGNLLHCTMGDDGYEMAVGMFFVVFWPYVILGIGLLAIFIVWKIRK